MSFIHISLSSMSLILLLALASTVSTSLNPKIGFQVTLRRVDSDGNFTKSELLQRAMKRGRKRVERLYSRTTLDASNVDIDAPVHPGGNDFLMDLSIGTPPMPFSAILDTGSDLIWTQCQPCTQCFEQQTPIFDPKSSSSFSLLQCSSDLCRALPSSSCTNGNCIYLYGYGDGSTTQGVMVTETFTFDKVSFPTLGFGCGLEQKGHFIGAGLVGMGRGPLSLVSQLDVPKFSYCLTPYDSKSDSTLLMGSRANANSPSGNSIITTPLIQNSLKPLFYFISLKGISVGETLLPIDTSTFEIKSDGSGGMIIDSGTTFSYLEESAFDLVKEEFSNQIQFPVSEGELDFCFALPQGATSDQLPTLTFHFEGGADLELSPSNYLIRDKNGLGCLAMENSKDISIFGNIMHHNMLVLYDLAQETLSFVPTNCGE